jgi:hypothetical protein
MTDKAREAVDQVRELSGDITDVLNGGMPHDSMTYRGSLLWDLLDAAIVLQEACVGDRQKKDGFPATIDWWQDVGAEVAVTKRFGLVIGCLHLFPASPGFDLPYAAIGICTYKYGAADVFHQIPWPTTVGDARRLCAALGIELKEAK